MINLEEIKMISIPGISPGTALYLCENALACFCRQGHNSGVSLECHGISEQSEPVEWTTEYTQQMDRSLNDQEVATEHGAVCISILFAIHHTEYTVIMRARKKTGVDYWLCRKEDFLFQNAARMEVSGIFNNPNQVAIRIKKKIKQSNQSDSSSLPAYISVVEFSRPIIHFIKKS